MKLRFPILNIGQQFVGYLMFFSVIPLLVVGIITYRNSSELLQNEAERSTTQLITNQKEYLELQLSELENLLVNISSADAIRETLANDQTTQNTYTNLATQAKMGYILDGYINLTGLISIDIFAINGSHFHVGDTLNTENIRNDVKDRIFEQTKQDSQPIVWIGVEDNINVNSSYKKVLVVSKGLYKIDVTTHMQKLIAVFLASYNIDQLYEHFDKIDFGQGAYLVVTDAKNRIIYHPDRSLVGSTAAPEAMQNLSDADTTFTTSVDGIQTLINYTASPLKGWKLASFIPISTFTAQSSVIGNTISLVLLISFGIVIASALFYNRRVVHPIREITERFKALRTGNVDNQHPFPERGKDEIGQLIQWFNAFLDSLKIRQQKEQELRDREAERELLIQKLEESLQFKDQFLATMSHELRTPLNAIQGYSGLISIEDISDDMRYMMDRILANSAQLLNLINDVLDLSRINSQKIELFPVPINLRDLVENWYNDFRPQAEKHKLGFALVYDSTLPATIRGDEARLTQIAFNLLQNALKFTQEGRIELKVHRVQDRWEFTISDTGIGIAEEWHHLIFDEFRQVDGSSKRKYGGAGLGLSIVKKLCIAMGGTVSVASQPGIGSAFTVNMPLQITDPVARNSNGKLQ